jgi:hypothetical protein
MNSWRTFNPLCAFHYVPVWIGNMWYIWIRVHFCRHPLIFLVIYVRKDLIHASWSSMSVENVLGCHESYADRTTNKKHVSTRIVAESQQARWIFVSSQSQVRLRVRIPFNIYADHLWNSLVSFLTFERDCHHVFRQGLLSSWLGSKVDCETIASSWKDDNKASSPD